MRRIPPALPFLGFAACAALLSGCPEDPPTDSDGDGFAAEEDCNDLDASVNPGMGELCDGLDNDCDGTTDEGYDEDGDGSNTCGPDRDCDDSNPAVLPGAMELCDGLDNDCDGATDEDGGSDSDGDGFCSGQDCDDGNSAVFPGASETCNGVDDDCDGSTDEGFDGDSDGYVPCGATPDCDDSDSSVFPGASELCNHADDDCDGAVDENFDADLDGVSTCASPADCDDSDATVWPGAPELCDSQDNDCDTQIDEGASVDSDGDGYAACNGDCDDTDPSVKPGALEYANGVDDDCDGVVDDGYQGGYLVSQFSPKATGATVQGRLGDRISTDGYLDSDSRSDFVVGSPIHDNGKGRVEIYRGTSFSAAAPPAALTPFATITGTADGSYLGNSVDLADLNDDGYDDVIVGKPQIGSASPPAGAVYVWFGGAVLTGGNWPLASADVVITGAFPTEQCGTAVAGLGDVNGDGYGDLGFSCPWYDSGGGNLVGRTAIFFGAASWGASYDTGDADATYVGGSGDQYSGAALAGDFDFNGDGNSDFAIGSPEWGGGAGRVSVFVGQGGGWAQGISLDSAARSYSGSAGHGAGSWLSVGDADTDAFDDLLVGASTGLSGRGVFAVLRGAAPPPASGNVWSAGQFYVTGASGAADGVGTAAGLADLDGDGWPDLLLSGPGYDGALGGDQGRLWQLPGPLTAFSGSEGAPEPLADAFWTGETTGDALGAALGTLADFNGDGAPDLVVSSPYNDAGGGNAGRLYFVPGM
jgi:hypothetical protein